MLLNQKMETIQTVFEVSELMEHRLENVDIKNSDCTCYKELLQETIFMDIKNEITEEKIKKLDRNYFSLLNDIIKKFIEIAQLEKFKSLIDTHNKKEIFFINETIVKVKLKLEKGLKKINLFFIY